MWILVALALGLAGCDAVSHRSKHRRAYLYTYCSRLNISMWSLLLPGSISPIPYWARGVTRRGFWFPLS